MCIYFRGAGEQRQNFEGNRGTNLKTIFGNRVHKKTVFLIFGEQASLFQGNKGTGTPPPWEDLTIVENIAIARTRWTC